MSYNKFIIVLGTTYSGSGAVYDFLSTRHDCYDPLKGSEYLLPQLPYGLMALRSTTNLAFHHATADHAFRKFLTISEMLARPKSAFFFGKNFEYLIPGFMDEIQNFLDKISISRFPFRIAWWDINKGVIERMFDACWEKLLRLERPVDGTYLPVSEAEFLSLSQDMHDKIFSIPDNSNYKFTLLNQAGSGINPIASTDFFRSRKVILVTRDPRDQFAELKLYKNAKNVGEFIKWYKAISDRIAYDHPDLHVVKFEDFVLNHVQQAAEICKFSGISDSITSLYCPKKSEKNLHKFNDIISMSEKVEIENHLSDYCV